MKRFITSLKIFVAVLLLFAITPIVATAEETNDQDLTFEKAMDIVTNEDIENYKAQSEEEIIDRKTAISEGYDEGDVLSKEDTLFLLTQSVVERHEQNEEISTKGIKSSKSFTVSKKKYGTKVTVKGTMYQNIAFIAGTSSYRGNIIATRNSGKLKQVSLKTYHDSFGIIGWGGGFPSIGKVYGGKVSHKKVANAKKYAMDKTHRYNSIIPAYTTMWTKASVVTKSNNAYDVASKTWSKWH
ncbi:hypothetical protein MH206_04670 [Bacillus altitudinis]|uniref:hypothetical protein n=1 Tax=Bacillus TaxID=1386 RepID=UPI00227FB820|nr:hypothetical protein [Bacillus altitudinis]MCY7628327.1 hypothetical protein [Bacillus altitudinis]MDX2364807.1 hypothetical protein [Bacillus altitudinis]